MSLIEYGTPLCSITIWQRKGNGKFLESSIICFSLGNQICHLHCEGTGLITYNEDIARYMLTTNMLTLNLIVNLTESWPEKNLAESLQYFIANIYRLLSECSIGWNLII